MRSLKEIALELLDKYEDSEMGCISEGISIIDDMKELDEECKWYREEIEAAASVVERKRGRWTSDGHCSECGEHAPFWPMSSTYHKTPYCYNCGADMREENE